MKMFEVVLIGFDGATDATDHLIKWVWADDEAMASAAASSEWGEVKAIQELPGFAGFAVGWVADLRAE